MNQWKLMGEDSVMITFYRGDDFTKQYIHYDKASKTIRCHEQFFELNKNCTWEEQKAEMNPAIKFSCKYGSWHRDDLDIDLETAKLILSLLEKNGGT